MQSFALLRPLGAFVGSVLVMACSHRDAPIAGPEPAPPAAREERREAGPLRLAAAVEAKDAGATPPPSLAGRTVLLIGDSMVGNPGLAKGLDAHFSAEGAKFVHDFKVSESIQSFDKSARLRRLMEKHHPDIVIVTLGVNDATVPYPQALATNVQNIVKRVGARECYWMGPPSWKKETALISVIRDNALPCKFFDSSQLKLARAGDGVHPTDRGGADWADYFWTFFRSPAGAADAGAL